jgi:Mg2+/Co2+ transporter CorB
MINVVVALLLSLSIGIFTASETGLVSIERVKLLKAKREKKKWAVRLHKFIDTP